MLQILSERSRQGHRTSGYPLALPVLAERFRGVPRLDSTRCESGCQACIEACPNESLTRGEQGLTLDLGRCLFCTECSQACPSGAVRFTTDHRLAASTRDDLKITEQRTLTLAGALQRRALAVFGRSLRLRHVSAGGCNGCESELNALLTPEFDLSRFGIQFVTSPRHADGLVVSGPVTMNMRLALEQTYAAMPDPKFVIAVGACAISGGPFADLPEQLGGVDPLLKVDLYLPGCPPHPYTLLDGLLRLLGRLPAALDDALNARLASPETVALPLPAPARD